MGVMDPIETFTFGKFVVWAFLGLTAGGLSIGVALFWQLKENFSKIREELSGIRIELGIAAAVTTEKLKTLENAQGATAMRLERLEGNHGDLDRRFIGFSSAYRRLHPSDDS